MFRKKIQLNIFFVATLLGGAVLTGAFMQRAGFFSGWLASGESSDSAAILGDLTYQIDTFNLEIPDSGYQVLSGNREEAMKKGFLYEEIRDEVLGTLSTSGKNYNVTVRLKGDLPDHWSDTLAWSFRVKVKGDNAIKGIKKFNLQRPGTRGDLNEWLFHELLKSHNLIHLRYRFVYLNINGKNAGLYALEEHLEKRLIENNNLRAGPIFKLNTSLYWHSKQGVATAVYGAPIKPYSIGKMKKSNPTYKQFLLAKDLLEGFRTGKLKVNEVFDAEKLATYMAIIDLTGHHHASSLDNMKFYYNPITALIEPIGYDNSTMKLLQEEYLLDNGKLLGERRSIRSISDDSEVWSVDWYERLFSDRTFFEQYVYALQRISASAQMKTFWEGIRQDFDQLQLLFSIEKPKYVCEAEAILNQNADFIQKLLHPNSTVQAYVLNPKDSLQDGVQILCANIHSLPVKIHGAIYKDSAELKLINDDLLQACGAKSVDESYAVFHFRGDVDINYGRKLYKRLTLQYSLLGSTDTFETKLFAWDRYDETAINQLRNSKLPSANQFNFLVEANNSYIIKQGDWKMDKTLVVPIGKRLIIEPGTSIELVNDAAIVSFSPVTIVGTKEAPIRIVSDGTGQGLLVMSAQEQSYLDHVIFKGLSRFKSSYWELPGAVSFYEANVTISNAVFDHNYVGDDYLNIVRSNFELASSKFTNVNADAFDGDFVTGTINDVSFTDIGNDGIDFSGSFIEANGISFIRVGDKAISGGERSKIEASNVLVKNAELAVTSKDDSEVVVTNIEIVDTRVGFCAFEKKEEFGRAIIRAMNVQLGELEVPYMIEYNSQLYVDKKLIASEFEDVKAVLYGNEYGKSSR